MMQFGFEFYTDAPRGVGIEQPPGTWLMPCETAASYGARLATARERVQGIVGVFRVLFERGLIHADRYLMEQGARSGDEPFSWYGGRVQIEADELERFAPHCLAPGLDDIETVHRDKGHAELWAMHVPGLGTFKAFRWPSGIGATFTLGRDPVMRSSFADGRPIHHAPAALWRPCYCADKLAEAGQHAASVQPFEYGGREWINGGGVSCAGRDSCDAWQIVPPEDWQGQTYSYATQARAWDAGTLERGDRRGLLVSVRGQRCVLADMATFVD